MSNAERASRLTFHDASGAGAIELWRVEGMSHGVALDAKNGCGKAGAFMLDVALCSTQKTADFFGFTPSTTANTATPPPGNGTRPTDCN